MPEMCTWIAFHAHPTRFERSRDNHPDFFGVFVCPVLRGEPEQLLKELLTNRKLFLTTIGDTQQKSKSADWGLNERLKAQLELEGFGLSLTKMHTRVIPID